MLVDPALSALSPILSATTLLCGFSAQHSSVKALRHSFLVSTCRPFSCLQVLIQIHILREDILD